MPTKKPRLNISMSKGMKEAISKLAKRDGVPQATKASRLIELALEIEEDRIWEEIASKRDNKKDKFISHEDAWK
ncbi:MAG: hypothetical protein WD607_11055 [Candidatus Paceibacterota bacterium]